MPTPLDRETLAAALIGYQKQLEQIEDRMAELRTRLGQRSAQDGAGALPGKRRTMSEAGRRSIAAAQRKRCAAVRRAQRTKQRT